MLFLLLLLLVFVPLVKWAGRVFLALGALVLLLTGFAFLAEHGGGALAVAVLAIVAGSVLFFRRRNRH
ncbi:hypothetical protein [Parafrankia sp. BMG5.11]|uniref:hypothetical protein n=1 Tax=Parafrankia sp. BMG5.11 TaxID=222540 RepID=UPI00103A1B70|nr:hypothetical protein [Parafrankia sp. BMG5.11]TCJ32165.1 hypothetical protein E0504_44650 [Parafrankia sp. BMG5.11]